MKELSRLYRYVDIGKRPDGCPSGGRDNRFTAEDSARKLRKESELEQNIKQEKQRSLRGDIAYDDYKGFVKKTRENYPYVNFDRICQKAEREAKEIHDRYEIGQKTMKGKICLVTGATSGIGKATALELANRGADVVIVGRNQEKCKTTVDEIRTLTGNESIRYLVADLSSQRAVRRLAQEFEKKYDQLDVLINNAGITLFQRESSVDGIEKTLATNHLAYFMLTNLLANRLRDSTSARIINVSSIAHTWARFDTNLDAEKLQASSGPKAYYASKLANVLFTKELAQRLEGTNITVNALNPGYVDTNIGKADESIIGKTIMPIAHWWNESVSSEKGAETGVYLATSPEVKGISGKYFEEVKEVISSEQTYDEDIARKLWNISRQLTKMSEDEIF